MRNAWADLRLSPMRSILTAASLFVGILAIVVIVAGGAVARDYLLAVAEQRDGRAPTESITINLDESTSPAAVSQLLDHLPQTTTRAIAARLTPANPLLLAPLTETGEPLRHSATQTEIIAGNLDDVRRLPIVAGRWFSSSLQDTPYEVVINKEAERSLGTAGSTIAMTSGDDATASTAVVVGIINDGDDAQANAYVKATPLLAHAPQLLQPTTVQLLWHSTGDSVDDIDSAVEDMSADFGLPTPESARRVDTVGAYLEPISAIQIMFSTAAALALLVAALGIVNVGLSSIRERSRELVIRRAIGATRTQIFLLVVRSSVLLAVFVAAAAITVAVALVAAVPSFLPPDTPVEPPAFPWVAAALGLVVAVSTAVVSSAVPAWKAATMEPATALRD